MSPPPWCFFCKKRGMGMKICTLKRFLIACVLIVAVSFYCYVSLVGHFYCFSFEYKLCQRPPHSPVAYVVDGIRPIFINRSLVIWNADSHPAPALDIRSFVEPMGVRFLQFDLSRYCHHYDLCQERQSLKVLSSLNVYFIGPSYVEAFHEAYKDDPFMNKVDAFLCSDIVANCQLYIPFRKPIVVYATNRYHVFRFSLDQWKSWNRDLQRLAADRRNVIAANNLYDVNFIRYFTGIEPMYIQSYSGYVNVSYRPVRAGFLLASTRSQSHRYSVGWLLGQIENVAKSAKFAESVCVPLVFPVRRLYKSFGFEDLASHRGIVHIPYQVSTMSLFEQYRMNVPLFFPSRQLLVRWDVEDTVVDERTLPWRERHPLTLPPHPSQSHVPSPNEQQNATAVDYWMQFADFYTLPHIQYFDSVDHLVRMLCELTDADLRMISTRMREYNKRLQAELTDKWRKVMLHLAAAGGSSSLP